MRNLLLAIALGPAAVYGFSPQNLPVDASAMQPYEAHALSVTGTVSRVRDRQPWAVSTGEQIPVRQIISTGSDGTAHFTVAGGAYFDIFSNSRLVFRENTASAGDLLDLISGRVRVHLQPSISQPQQRVFTPTAIISTNRAATVALALDQDDTLRIDVLEGDVRVQHTRLPKSEPTVVRAIDAILVRPDEAISRRVDRGSLYRYTVKPFKDIWGAVTPGHSGSHNGDVIEGENVVARMVPSQFTSHGSKASF
jgi:hypothetical protein